MSIIDLHAVPSRRTEIPITPSRLGYDLLRFRPVRSFVQWAGFPYVFQVILLGAFVSLAVSAWGLFPPAGVQDKLFAKTNLVTLLVWGLWWPAMVWTAVLFGRAWCAVCPLEFNWSTQPAATGHGQRIVAVVGDRRHDRLTLGVPRLVGFK